MSRFQEGSLLRLKRKTGRMPGFSVGTRRSTENEVPQVRHRNRRAVADAARCGTGDPGRCFGATSTLSRGHRKRSPSSLPTIESMKSVPERKAFATIESTGHYLKRHIETKFGSKRLLEIRTVDVEKWLHSLNYAPGTRSKIRNIMSALFNHAMRSN